MPQMKISVSYLHCTSDISQTMSWITLKMYCCESNRSQEIQCIFH